MYARPSELLTASFLDELEKISSKGGFFEGLSNMLPSFMRPAQKASDQGAAVVQQVKAALPPKVPGAPDPRAQLAAMKAQRQQTRVGETLAASRAMDENPAVRALREKSQIKTASIEYRGTTFPGYNKPIPSNRKGKKKMVLVKRGDRVKLVHFGQKGYQDFTQHKDPERRKNYLKRSGGIRGKGGKLTASDPFSANYWARKELW